MIGSTIAQASGNLAGFSGELANVFREIWGREWKPAEFENRLLSPHQRGAGTTSSLFNNIESVMTKEKRLGYKDNWIWKEGGANDVFTTIQGLNQTALTGSSPLFDILDQNKEKDKLIDQPLFSTRSPAIDLLPNQPAAPAHEPAAPANLGAEQPQTPLYSNTGLGTKPTNIGANPTNLDLLYGHSYSDPLNQSYSPEYLNFSPTTPSQAGFPANEMRTLGALGLQEGGKAEDGSVTVNVEKNEKRVTYDENYNVVKIEDVKTGKSHEQGGKDTVLEENQAILNEKQYAALKQGTPLKDILDTLPDVSDIKYAQGGVHNEDEEEPEGYRKVEGYVDDFTKEFNTQVKDLFGDFRSTLFPKGKAEVQEDINSLYGGDMEAYHDYLRKKYNHPDFRGRTRDLQTVPIGRYGVPAAQPTTKPEEIIDKATTQGQATTPTARRTPAAAPKETSIYPDVPLQAGFEDIPDELQHLIPTPEPQSTFGYNSRQYGETGIMPKFSGVTTASASPAGKKLRGKESKGGDRSLARSDYGYPEKYLSTNLGSNIGSALYNIFNYPDEYIVPRTEVGDYTPVATKYESVEPIIAENERALNTAINKVQELGQPHLIPLIVKNFKEQNEKIYTKLASINAAKEQRANELNVQAFNRRTALQAGLDAERMKMQTGVDMKQAEVDRERVNQINESLFNMGRAWGDYSYAKYEQDEREELMRLYRAGLIS